MATGQTTEHFPDFSPVRPKRTFEEIILQIEQAVIEGRLAVGDRLPPERELAEIFKVGRSSVREALRVLEAFGVLTSRRGVGAESGSIVSAQGTRGLAGLLRLYTSLQGIPLRDLVEIRLEIEKFTVRLAAERANAENSMRLAHIVEQMQKAEEHGEFLQCDTELHIAIARMSGNSLAPLLMEALREAMAREMLKAFRDLADWPGERRILIRDHEKIAAKIQAGDGEAAVLAMTRHISGFYGRVLEAGADSHPKPGRRGPEGLAPARAS